MKNLPCPTEFHFVRNYFYTVAVYLHVLASPKNTGPQKGLSFLLPFAEQGLNFFLCSLAATFETSVVGLGVGSIAPPPNVTVALGDLFKCRYWSVKEEIAHLDKPSLRPF